MNDDKICPLCGGLMMYVNKGEFKAYLCFDCGHVEVIKKFAFW